jgi:hypothetical protein
MKSRFLLLMLVFCMNLSAQSVRGLYQGKLYNDTTKQLQNYELALSEYRGKIMGYSYTTFVSNDTFYYGVRRIKGRIENNQLIVEDQEFIGHNYPEAPAKGVGRISVIPLNGQDSVVDLNGKWQTNRTKKYYSIPGTIDLKKTEDSASSELITHLKQMNIIADPRQTGTAVATAKPKATPKESKPKAVAAVNNDIAKKDNKQAVKKPEPVTTAVKPVAEVIPVITKMPVDQRRQNALKAVEVSSDSIVLAFYDNGIIDGDSVSVYLNGENILSATKLTSIATKKTVYLKNSDSEFRLLLVAENLGTIPPNTGLLVVRDGETQYQMNFSADLQTNATLVIRKKKKE